MATTNRVCVAEKGEKGGKCNRKACREDGAFWYNKSTLKYYCKECAFEIMSFPENKGLLVNEKDFSHPYSVEWADSDGLQIRNFATSTGAVSFASGMPNSQIRVRPTPTAQ